MSAVQRARLVVALAVLNLVLVGAALAVGGYDGGWPTAVGGPAPSAAASAGPPLTLRPSPVSSARAESVTARARL